jgi:beta-xylosidase
MMLEEPRWATLLLFSSLVGFHSNVASKKIDSRYLDATEKVVRCSRAADMSFLTDWSHTAFVSTMHRAFSGLTMIVKNFLG